MNEALRSLRLGAVSLFGVAVPGFVLIFLGAVGLLVPCLAMSLHASGVSWRTAAGFAHADRWLVVGAVLIFSYVAGYILRLTSPDKLDKISIEQVLANLSAEERAVWPCRGDADDKFPYFHFRSYLKARGHDDLLPHVLWGPDGDEETTKRSKTAVHRMKLDIFLANPQLSDVVDSNEAHIRLMAGIWLATRTTTGFLITGLVVASIGLILIHSSLLHDLASVPGFTVADAPPYAAFLAVNAFLLASGFWAVRRIESLFHYRRVNELVFITMAAHVARQAQPQSAPARERSSLEGA